MIRKLLLTFSLLLSLSAYSQSADAKLTADTLLNVKSANNISITYSEKFTYVTVWNLDGGRDNFYYQYGKLKTHPHAQTGLTYSDISSVVISETPSELNISFNDSKGDALSYNFPFSDPANRDVKSYIGTKGSDFGFTILRSKDSKTQWEVISQGLSFGWCAPTDAKPSLGTSMWKSNELSWLMMLGVRMRHRSNSLEFGLGLRWQNFVTKDDKYFHKNPDGSIALTPYDEGMSDTRSRIKIFSLQVPVLYGLTFGHKHYCGFKIGPVINFNTSGSIKTQYEFEGREYSVKTNHIGQRPVTVDALAAFNYRAIGLYFRYSPMNLMRDKTGLDFNAISTGIMIGF